MHLFPDIQKTLLVTCYVPDTVLCDEKTEQSGMLFVLKLLVAYACQRKQVGSSFQSKHLTELQKVHGWLVSRKPNSFDGIRVQENLVASVTQAVLVSLLQQWARLLSLCPDIWTLLQIGGEKHSGYSLRFCQLSYTEKVKTWASDGKKGTYFIITLCMTHAVCFEILSLRDF